MQKEHVDVENRFQYSELTLYLFIFFVLFKTMSKDMKLLFENFRKFVNESKEEENKHAMWNLETGQKTMADGKKHEELAAKGEVHFDPNAVKDALKKEGGAAGLDAIVDITGADKEELEKNIEKIPGVGKHKDGDYILDDGEDIKVEQLVREAVRLFLEKKKKKKRKKKKKNSSGKKDACYHKVKARYSVWPSAYASGALSKCRDVGAQNWGNKSKKK